MTIKEESLQKHYEWNGKIEVVSRVEIKDKKALSLAYTPGVAEACMKIHADKDESYKLTRRSNMVAVITDGTAVLGLGDIGPEAGMPVMEGKCCLFKEFGGVDAFPICVKTKDTEELISTIYNISGSFGGINLEDISAPRCFEVEKRLKALCDIPVFHDDQHGTAIVVGAALINALKIVKKSISDIKCVICGAGSAGISIATLLLSMGMKNIVMVNSKGIISKNDDKLNDAQKEIALVTNKEGKTGSLKDAMCGTDLFIGVSKANLVTEDMVKSMNNDPILFTMANPDPEIERDKAIAAGARIIGTGRSDYPNQINNVLAFPGIFRGALNVRASDINDEMIIAATHAIAGLVSDSELSEEYILPRAFDKRVGATVAKAVEEAAKRSGVARI